MSQRRAQSEHYFEQQKQGIEVLTGEMLRRSALRVPNKPAILQDGIALSYRDLDAQANRLAHALVGLGLGKSAKVAMLSRNRAEYGVVFFGMSRTNYVLANVSVLYSAEELAFVLDKADAQALIFEDLFADRVAAVRTRLPKLRHLIVIGEKSLDATPFSEFIANRPTDEPAVAISESDPFCMTYTGGTTGRPKGVLSSHRSRTLTAHTVMVEEALDERDVVGIITPMFHVAALNMLFQPAILAAATTVFLRKWSVEDFARMVRETRMTATFMVPTQVSMVVSDPAFDRANYRTWKKLSFAGAPMPDWVQRAMLEKLPDVKLTQVYGQSETSILTVLHHWHLPEKLGSVGRQAYNVELRIVDADGVPVKAGQVGEVVSRGDNLMLEYYNEPEQTAAFFRNGWGWTGDLATIDEAGFVTLVDRSKDMINSGGEKIYPKEIEDVLYAHGTVAECAVFGIPDAKWGEVPAAYIKLKSGVEVPEDSLIAYCTQHLARFKRPRLVKFVDDFPKTPIGKIQKNLLREPYWAGRKKKI